MTVTSTQILEQVKPEDKNLLQSKTLVRTFGREEDCVELHVYDLNNNLLTSNYNFDSYEIPDIENEEGLFSEITFNPDRALRKLGFTTGKYKLQINFHRKQILNTSDNLFFIESISPNRTELKVKLKDTDNLSSLLFAVNNFIALLGDTIEGVSYFKDFALNLNNNIILTGVNFIAEEGVSNSFFIKLYEPLPNSLGEKTQFRIVEELTDPIEYTVDLGAPEVFIDTTELRGPNLRIDTRLNSSTPSQYKAYNDILQYEVTSSLYNVLNAISASIPISVEYDNPVTDSGYTFEKFIHFSSAEERVRNFKYKLELIELYDSRSLFLSENNTAFLQNEKENNQSLKSNLISGFDNYERFLYFESGTYSWPKSNDTYPFELFSVSSSEGLTWFGSLNENSPYNGGQLVSASNYDGENPYILRNTLPQYIIDNNQNEDLITFVDMIGQHFDNIWIYIENITDKNIAHNSLKEGISKDLVFEALKEKGIPAFDQFENADIFNYLIGDGTNNSLEDLTAELITENEEALLTELGDGMVINQTAQTLITASNGLIPREDISKEVWKRLYHNAPYLLKTKGTERGIKALMACYGIPETILHVKEYGGPSADKSGFRTFKYLKTSKGLQIKGANFTQKLKFTHLPHNGTNLFGAGDIGARTVEFTLLIDRYGDLIDNAASGRNLILTDRNSFSNYSFFPDTAYSGSGRFQFQNLFGAKAALIDPAPYTSGRPVTFYIYTTSNPEEFDIYATIFIDGEYIENKDLSALFAEPLTSLDGKEFGLGTNVDISALTDVSSSFTIQHFKVYTSSLSPETRRIHTKDPSIIAGNNTSSYFNNELFFYNPLGGNLKTENFEDATEGNPYSFVDYSQNDNSNASVGNIKALGNIEYNDVTYDHYISTPDTVGASMASEKIRYDSGSIPDNILSPAVKAEESTMDRQPPDFSNLGIFFSPTFEINEDIVHTLGGFRLDDYIGDPRHLDSGSYPDLKSLRDQYHQKVLHRYNFFEYIRTIQFFDHTLFKIIEEFVPAKTNLKTGIVIEPHFLERNKLTYANSDFSINPLPDIIYKSTTGSLESEYILFTSPGDKMGSASINLTEVLSGSAGSFENNFVHAPLSKKYFRISENR